MGAVSRGASPAMPPPVLLLLLGALCLPPARAGSHSHLYFSSVLSGGLPGVPQFSAVGFVDDEEIEAYSSWTRRVEPRAPWMGRVAESDPGYWESQTETARGNEALNKANVKTLMGRHNQTAGLHVVQRMSGCELRGDGSVGGSLQFAYDGRDSLSLDLENMRFTATLDAAKLTADRWNAEGGLQAQKDKAYLEQECTEWLRKYLEYGEERLERRVPPQAMISRKKSHSATTLTCYAYGFYPRDIEMKWVRNGVEVDWKTKTILPNTDGTYQIRSTVELPEGDNEKDYRCEVDHIGLEEIIIKVYKEEPGTQNILVIVGVIVGVLVVLAAVAAAVIWKRNHQGKSNSVAKNQGQNGYAAVNSTGISGKSNSFATNQGQNGYVAVNSAGIAGPDSTSSNSSV